jgi:hypothetical protein
MDFLDEEGEQKSVGRNTCFARDMQQSYVDEKN